MKDDRPLTDEQKALAATCYRMAWAEAIAFGIRHSDRDLDDILAEATFAVVRAARRYDPRHPSGAQFQTFCCWAIRRNLQRDQARAVQLRQRFGPLDERYNGLEAAEEETDGAHAWLPALLGRLSERDRTVLAQRHLLGWTFREIGAALDITREAARYAVRSAEGHARVAALGLAGVSLGEYRGSPESDTAFTP